MVWLFSYQRTVNSPLSLIPRTNALTTPAHTAVITHHGKTSAANGIDLPLAAVIFSTAERPRPVSKRVKQRSRCVVRWWCAGTFQFNIVFQCFNVQTYPVFTVGLTEDVTAYPQRSIFVITVIDSCAFSTPGRWLTPACRYCWNCC